MPDPSEHETQAEKNERFADEISSNYTDYDDWLITSKFYAALHYVDCTLVNDDRQANNHTDRKNMMKDSRDVSPRAFSLYKSLYEMSLRSRYECMEVESRHISRAEKCLVGIKSQLGFS